MPAGKPTVHWPALGLSVVAAAGFVAGWLGPFVSSDFDPRVPEGVAGFVDGSLRGAGGILDVVGDLIGDEAAGATRDAGLRTLGRSLDKMLGEVGSRGGDERGSWGGCLGGSVGDVQGRWRGCVKIWMAHKAGIPVGIQTIPGVISGLFSSGELLLALALVLFSGCFPALKVLLSVWLSTGIGSEAGRRRLYRVLEHTSKWSMTDVFVVAMLITFFKAASFNFHFQAEVGVFAFAAGALLSSLAVSLLHQRLRPREAAPS